MNYVPYLYKYKGIVPFFLTNNSGINGAESKRTKTINKPIQKIRSFYKKFLYDFESGKIKHKQNPQ